ncbi:hypothetical protein PI124_g12233 [Phytophthora idaei]|nr:hypothetical protein PI125_g19333 [Phytophthora idaei]KAG3150847.1 hypothetical protein PI126_g11294 [Phytophthora idaei]KAG3242936.1 hypothetical protein PI124_g12233 [Phytophthora idaei]
MYERPHNYGYSDYYSQLYGYGDYYSYGDYYGTGCGDSYNYGSYRYCCKNDHGTRKTTRSMATTTTTTPTNGFCLK